MLIAYRFRRLLHLPGRFDVLVGITNLHSMFNYLLPAKLGELSFPLLLSKRLDVPVATSTASLGVARFFDLGAIALVLPLVLYPLQARLPDWIVSLSLIYIVCVTVGGFCLWFYVRRSRLPEPETQATNTLLTRARRLRWQILGHLKSIDDSGQYLRLWLLTILIWLIQFFYLYLVVRGLNLDASYLQMVVTTIFLVPLSILPLQGFANIGTHEAAWVSAFVLFGATASDALTIAVLSHVVLFVFVLMLGISGGLLSRPEKSSRQIVGVD